MAQPHQGRVHHRLPDRQRAAGPVGRAPRPGPHADASRPERGGPPRPVPGVRRRGQAPLQGGHVDPQGREVPVLPGSRNRGFRGFQRLRGDPDGAERVDLRPLDTAAARRHARCLPVHPGDCLAGPVRHRPGRLVDPLDPAPVWCRSFLRAGYLLRTGHGPVPRERVPHVGHHVYLADRGRSGTVLVGIHPLPGVRHLLHQRHR